MKKVFYLILLIFLLFTASFAETVTTNTEGVPVQKDVGNTQVIAKIPNNTAVTKLDEKDKFYKITYKNVEGWIYMANTIEGQNAAPDPDKATLEKKSTHSGRYDMGYWLYKPENPKNEKMPLIVYLHGLNERGNNLDALAAQRSTPVKYFQEKTLAVNAIVAVPQCPGDKNTFPIPGVIALIDELIQEQNVDTDRICLAGFSNGGYATWLISNDKPSYFAALVVMSGGPPSTSGYQKCKDMGVWIFGGTRDGDTAQAAEDIKNKFERAGSTKAKFTAIEGAGHVDVAARGLTEFGLFDWIVEQHK